MSSAEVVIDRAAPLPREQDFFTLREDALEHLRKLCGDRWTDHGLHDPGITSLEALVHALTDCAYRTDFPVADLLARARGATGPPPTSSLFPPEIILPTAPLTLDDYRRQLMKVEGVRNAWLLPILTGHSGEVDFYADRVAGALSYDSSNSEGERNELVLPKGLYRVLLELEIDNELGPLNAPWISHRIAEVASARGAVLALSSTDPKLRAADTDFERNLTSVAVSDPVTQDASVAGLFRTTASLRFGSGPNLKLDVAVRLIEDRPDFDPDLDAIALTETTIRTVLEAGPGGPVFQLWRRHQKVQRSLHLARCALMANRNLCEDFTSITTAPVDPIAVCADVEVETGADLERVQAEVFFAIERYLNPPVPRYGLEELRHEGVPVDEIYDAPFIDYALQCDGQAVFTQPGFIKTDDLARSQLRTHVYASDLIDAIMDVPGVVAIRNLVLRGYDALGQPDLLSQAWTLEVEDGHQPMLSIEHSKLLFFKDEIPYLARFAEFERTLDHLRAVAQRKALAPAREPIAQPQGRYRDPGAFYSVQDDFPDTYGIGREGLPASADLTRRVQAHQLKGYLTVFDQLLADYVSQLAHLGRLFSLDEQQESYFPHVLREVPAVKDGDFVAEAFVVDPANLQQELLRLLEDKERFQERRNRLLDHLLARFGERLIAPPRFPDGDSLPPPYFEPTAAKLQTLSLPELIRLKREFLSDYPELSRRRSLGYDYSVANSFGSENGNISGLEARLSRIFGTGKGKLQRVSCEAALELLIDTRNVGGQFRVEFKDKKNNLLFKSRQLFATENAARGAGKRVYAGVHSPDGYRISPTAGGRFEFALILPGVRLDHDESFAREADAIRAIYAIAERHDEILNESCSDREHEDFHLIEHLLLRPRIATRNGSGDLIAPTDTLMRTCIEVGSEGCGDEDPYTFRISVVLPAWPKRFRTPGFRAFVERSVREETPAHIHARICWVDNAQMRALDASYEAWVDAQASELLPAAPELAEARAKLIDTLDTLKSVYPPAVLHDCDDDREEVPVRLDYTSLGTL